MLLENGTLDPLLIIPPKKFEAMTVSPMVEALKKAPLTGRWRFRVEENLNEEERESLLQ